MEHQDQPLAFVARPLGGGDERSGRSRLQDVQRAKAVGVRRRKRLGSTRGEARGREARAHERDDPGVVLSERIGEVADAAREAVRLEAVHDRVEDSRKLRARKVGEGGEVVR